MAISNEKSIINNEFVIEINDNDNLRNQSINSLWKILTRCGKAEMTCCYLEEKREAIPNDRDTLSVIMK